MNKQWKKLGVLISLIALLFLSACGNGGGNSAANGSGGSGKNILTVAQNADAVTLDPHKTNDSASANPMQQVYNTLVDLTPDMEVAPSLAESWEQVDDLTWEFKLRQGVKFHNGEELKASDVKFTYDRLLDPATAAPGSFLLADVSEVKVIDDYTVQIISKEPFAPLVYNLTHVATSILNEKAVTEAGEKYNQQPVGTGPFKFVSWEKSSKITFERYDDYFEGPASLEQIVFRIIPESGTAVAELKTGGIDMMLQLPSQHISQFKNSDTVEVNKVPSFQVKYLSFNMQEAPFDNPLVRQAINYATNKDAIIKAAYQGTAVTATSPLAPGLNGYNDQLEGYSYDVEKAKELLAEAGMPDGFDSTLYISDADIDTKIGTILQSQLKEVGINLELKVMEWGAFLDETANGVPMFVLSWTTVTGDADNGMYALFHSKNAGGPGNRSFYKNEEVDTLLDQGRAETDAAKREDYYKQAQETIVDDAAWDFLAVSENIVGVNKRVKGFENMPTTTYKFYSVTLE
ncbi:glutathione ABC transporter substrate-binding protein [Planococcus sp. YIM B11945]|uniref:glutathione ABC transporter substrate-binding protein n=1 Tax=Planococcus sp. YIM B11945 TaxID=3435410 RepID=UPI003D7CAFE7